MKAILLPVWRYRHFIASSIKNQLVVRFARSRLGGLWMILHPLAQVAIYALVLSEVLAARLPGIDNKHAYAIYLMAGMAAWSLFAEVLGQSLTVFIDNGPLLKKMAFPKLALPLIVVGGALLNNLLLLAAILAVFGLLGHPPTGQGLWLPALILLTLGLAAGLGLCLGIVNVFLRDIGQTLPIALQFWFWLTPIVYAPQVLPAHYADWLAYNPMTPIVAGYQAILMYGRAPDWPGLAYPALWAGVSLGLALFLYRRAGEDMVDAL